jgi:hypothetical protein
MLAVAARCIRLLPLRSPRALPPPTLALRARPPAARAFAPRSLAAAAMDGSDAEAKAPKSPAATAAGGEAPAAKAEKKPRARKAPAKKEKGGYEAEAAGDAEAAGGEKVAKKPKAEVEKAVLPRSDTPRKPPPAGCARLPCALRRDACGPARVACAPCLRRIPNNSATPQAGVQGALLERGGPARRAEQRHRRGAAAPGG